jgi:hypothetical protein
MKNLFYFLLGISLIVLTSATTVSVMTVKPATPKSIATFVGDINQCSKYIREYSQRGYVVKFMSQSQGQYSGYDETRCLVVMEKY